MLINPSSCPESGSSTLDFVYRLVLLLLLSVGTVLNVALTHLYICTYMLLLPFSSTPWSVVPCRVPSDPAAGCVEAAQSAHLGSR